MKILSVKHFVLMCAFILACMAGFAQAGFNYDAETTTEGVTLTNITRSTVTPCNGTANWRTTAFRNTVTNTWKSPHITFGGPTTLATMYVNYKVVVASGTGTWTISVDLYSSGTLVKAMGTVTGTASSAGAGCINTSKTSFFSPPISAPNEVRLTITTTNTTITASNYVQLDNVFCYFNALASVKAGTGGLTQPSYSTGYRNITRPGTDVFGDAYVTKSTQSSTSCPGNSDPDAPEPICKLTSVPGIHEVKIINKTTGDVTYGALNTFTVPYQAATYEQAYTNVQFEDATSYYVHYFTIPTVESSGTALYWRTYEVAQP